MRATANGECSYTNASTGSTGFAMTSSVAISPAKDIEGLFILDIEGEPEVDPEDPESEWYTADLHLQAHLCRAQLQDLAWRLQELGIEPKQLGG
jgi:hypothetical protein